MSDPWAHTITRENVEQLLDQGLLEIHMGRNRWWTVRRNGQTKRWKRDMRMRIPVKAGLYAYNEIYFGKDGSPHLWSFRLKTFAR